MTTVPQPLPTDRTQLLQQLAKNQRYDIAIVGGGATGLGVALDAASRGLRVVLIESHDFAHGTSSRSTKLVHGGVRYLAQGNVGLVREALHERAVMLRNAPHLAQPLPFVMPSYRWWEVPFYGAGLKLYDVMAGRAGLGRTECLSPAEALMQLPNLRAQGLKGGVQYWDGQFDDARFALALARTAALHGALLINHCRATDLIYAADKVTGVVCQDQFTSQTYEVRSPCVVNATGVWVDALRQRDDSVVPATAGQVVRPLVSPSQGVHLVVNPEFLNSQSAMMVPRTGDGRVLFAVPWLGKVILGTTDTPRNDLARDPLPFDDEIEFILRESKYYLRSAPQREDVKSTWVGLRPLVKRTQDVEGHTKRLSREHTIAVSRSGLVSVAGGKWTTYRAMAQEVLNVCQANQLIHGSARSRTEHLKLIGVDATHVPQPLCHAPGWHSYGAETPFVKTLPGADAYIAPGFTRAMVCFAVRYEYARTVEDVLARRSRMLFLDAALACEVAPTVAGLLERETGVDPQEASFLALTQQYLLKHHKKS